MIWSQLTVQLVSSTAEFMCFCRLIHVFRIVSWVTMNNSVISPANLAMLDVLVALDQLYQIVMLAVMMEL